MRSQGSWIKMNYKNILAENLQTLDESSQCPEDHIRFLEERVLYLEDINRFTLDALELATSLGDFQPTINKLQDPATILDETSSRIQRLIQLEAIAFFLVDEDTNDFSLTRIEPEHYDQYIQSEVDYLIDDGTFAWALREKRPIIVSSSKYEKQVILHLMATSSRIRGMFIGLLGKGHNDIQDLSLSLLSIILINSSNALESLELYRMIGEIKKNLEKKETYKNLFEAAPDGVEVLNARGKILDCNKTYKTLIGYNQPEIIGNHTTDFFSENSKTSFQQKFSLLQRNGYVESEVELLCRDGSLMPVWRKEKAIYNENREFVGAVIYNRDISMRKQAELEKKNLETQLQRSQKMEALGTLAGGVAHDLNNVLSGIVSFPELLLLDLPQDSPLRRPIGVIQKSGQKAAAIVQDLLALGRRGVVTREVTNLNYIIKEYLQSPENEKLKSFHPDIEFEIHLSDNLVNILGSPVHLSKTVMNLVSNAVEAMPDRGKITISTENGYIDRPIEGYENVEEGEYVVMTVSDTGIGISKEDTERIFEPFYTKKVMGRSGTGLGMAVIWGTVKDHKGYIDVQSAEGDGTTFTLFFPVTEKECDIDKSPLSAEDYKGKGETILIVDDVEEQREIASGMLEKLGYSVTSVSSGEAAIAYLKTESADLLVLDMIMDTGIDGLDTYKEILELHPRQKAIVASGFSETDRVKEVQRLGAGQFIKKPYTLEKIGVAIRDELEN